MQIHDNEYLDLVTDVLQNGVEKTDRTGTGTLSVFGRQMRFDLTDDSIPLLTTKKIHIPSIVHEILWYLSGSTNVKYLEDNNVTIWREWADKNGEIGPLYGATWRNWGDSGIDQIDQSIHLLKTDPDSRRIVVSAWNVAELENMALYPCHAFFQFYTHIDQHTQQRRLSCALTQRSCDVGLGVPYNIAQYSILTRMVAEVVNMQPGEFIWNGGDVHIYKNHINQLTEQLTRIPYQSPKLQLNNRDDIDKFEYDDFTFVDYIHHPAIKMEVSV